MTPNQLLSKSYLLYFTLFIFFFIFKNEEFPSYHYTTSMLVMLFCGLTFSKIALNDKHIHTSIRLIFAFHLISASVMRIINTYYFDNPLGADPIDAEFYRTIAQYLQGQNMTDSINWLSKNLTLDDIGYPIVLSFFSKPFGVEFGLQLMIIVNSILITLGSKFLYSIATTFLNQEYAKLATLLWGMMPFSVYTTAYGLKENIFVFTIICAFYFYYLFLRRHNILHFSLCIISVLCVLLFRIPTAYILALSLGLGLLFRLKKIQRNQNLILLCITILSFVSFQILATHILEQRNMTFEGIINAQEDKTSTHGGAIAIFTNYIAALIGPFPNFISHNEQVNFLWNLTPFLKMFISYFALYGAFLLLKEKETIFMPLIMFWLLNTIMLIFTFMTLHDRFQWMHIPCVLILSAIGLYKYNQKKRNKIFVTMYMCTIIAIIILFNYR